MDSRADRGKAPSVGDVFEDDDSAAFAEVERRHVRDVVGITDFDWVCAERPSPRNSLPVPLAEARVTLVTTAGAHEPGGQPPGAGGGAVLIPADSPVELTHPGYDTVRAMTDPDVVYPVRRLRALVEQGFIGSLGRRSSPPWASSPKAGAC